MTLGEKLRALRSDLGWSQERLAHLSGVSQSTVSLLEQDKALCSWVILRRLERTLGLSGGALMAGLEDPDKESINGVGSGLEAD